MSTTSRSCESFGSSDGRTARSPRPVEVEVGRTSEQTANQIARREAGLRTGPLLSVVEVDVPERSRSSATFGLTQRMAAASSRRPRRTLAIWGLVVLVALVLAGTSLKGLTTTAHVVGTTQSSQAEALYDRVVGSASQKPTDVIVVSSNELDRQRSGLQDIREQARDEGRNQPGHHQCRGQFRLGQPAGLG